MKLIFLLIFAFFTAQAKDKSSTLTVGQGLSSPSSTSLINWRHGFTYQNPAGIASVSNPQISAEFDDNNDSDDTGLGAELALGNGTFGIGLGYYKRSCDGCEGRMGAAAGFAASGWALGVGFHEEEAKSIGLMIGGDSGHRVGVVLDMNDENSNNKIQSHGIGYSYLGSGYALVIDASKRKDEVAATNDDVILITPGAMMSIDSFGLSVSYDMYSNDNDELYEDEMWAGIAYHSSKWDLAIYKDFVGDWSVNFVYKF